MVKTQIDAAGELQHAASLLFKNWMLIVPTAVAAVVISIFKVFFLGGIIGSGMLGYAVGGGIGAVLAAIVAALPLVLLFIVLAFLLTIISTAMVVHASEDVWEGRAVDLARSLSASLSRFAPLIGAGVLVGIVIFVCVGLSFVVIGLPLLLVSLYFLMYTVPAVILGNESAVGALSASYALARENVRATMFALLGIVIAGIIAAIIMALFQRNALLSIIASLIVGGYINAYVALVVARFYTLLRPQAQLPVTPA